MMDLDYLFRLVFDAAISISIVTLTLAGVVGVMRLINRWRR
jgi:hypothetical protein